MLLANPAGTYTVWVTRSDELRRRVAELCGQARNANVAFVSSPFVVLGAMAQATIREVKVRPAASAAADPDD